MPAATLTDTLDRPLRSLRISVTDRCNLRCRYCMPEKNYIWLPREALLTFEEIVTLVDVFADLGVTDIRLTGGEPLLRRNVDQLIALLAAKPSIRDIALTTNAVLLADQAARLRAAGLSRVTISIDSLRPDRFLAMTGSEDLARTLAGIAAASSAGFRGTKFNAVIVRNVNDDELGDLIAFARRNDGELRFIEYMDVGGATHWNATHVVSRTEMLDKLRDQHGHIEPIAERGSAPAQRFRLPDGNTFGIIASTTLPFCRTCDRARLTADGMLYLCLYATDGIDLRAMLRGGAGVHAIRDAIATAWRKRDDRGAELRRTIADRGPFVSLPQLRSDVHLEMHTRGG